MERDLEGLLAFFEARSRMPYKPGRRANDCVAFAIGAVRAQGGRVPLGRTRWSTERGARRVLRRVGGLKAAADALFMRVAPAKAMRGDIAGVPDDLLGVRLMIVEGDTLVGPGARGAERVPRAAMSVAWSAMRLRR